MKQLGKKKGKTWEVGAKAGDAMKVWAI